MIPGVKTISGKANVVHVSGAWGSGRHSEVLSKEF